MSKYSFFLVVVLCTLSSLLYAQQDARYTMYMYNGLIFNAGYAGSAERTCMNAFYRNQWVNIEGAPQTISASMNTALGKKSRIGVGGYVEYDKLGVHDRLSGSLSYAYRLPLGSGHLGMGVEGNVLYMRSNWDDVQLNPDGVNDDPTFQGTTRALLPNFGLGLFYHTQTFYLGLSAPRILEVKLNANQNIDTLTLARERTNYYGTVGVVVSLSDDWKLKPSALVKMIPTRAPIQTDLNLSVLYKNVFELGTSFRADGQFKPESVNAIAMLHFKSGLKIGYAYDFTLSRLQNYNSGSHEVTLGYEFGGKKMRYLTPRYF
jgi:type IX secretion system PorP/SprF family membrane protein